MSPLGYGCSRQSKSSWYDGTTVEHCSCPWCLREGDPLTCPLEKTPFVPNRVQRRALKHSRRILRPARLEGAL